MFWTCIIIYGVGFFIYAAALGENSENFEDTSPGTVFAWPIILLISMFVAVMVAIKIGYKKIRS